MIHVSPSPPSGHNAKLRKKNILWPLDGADIGFTHKNGNFTSDCANVLSHPHIERFIHRPPLGLGQHRKGGY